MKKRILHISPDFNYACGVSKHVFELIKYYDRRIEYSVYFITNGGDALARLENSNIKYSLLKFGKGRINILRLPLNYFYLKRFCVRNKINIIHTHHRYPEFLSNLLKKRLKLSTITTAHSFVRGIKILSFKSDKIISVSNAVNNTLQQSFNVPSGKIITLYNCIIPMKNIDINKTEELTKELIIKENDFVILFLGRINKVKGVDILIESFIKVSAEYSNLKLILLGSILDKSLSKMNINLNKNIIVLSEQSHVGSYYKISNLIILPSRVESLGYTMLEAGYFKKPFIGSRTGGIAEFIDDGVNGFLFEPGNVDDLADKIRYVVNNPEKAKSVAEELNKKVKKYCNCEEYFKKLTAAYEKLYME